MCSLGIHIDLLLESKWGQWEIFGECTRSCGGGKQMKRRICLTGDNCVGDEDTQQIDCNTDVQCPSMFVFLLNIHFSVL